MTDEDIVKAWEYCLVRQGECKKMSLRKLGCSIGNDDILDIIHRLRSENEYLKAEKQLAFDTVKGYSLTDIEQKAELERLTEKASYQRLELCKEIAVLRKQVDKWTVTASKWFERELELESCKSSRQRHGTGSVRIVYMSANHKRRFV